MAELNITQQEADHFINMEKQRTDNTEWQFAPGERLAIPLTSVDKRDSFILDMTRYQIKITKATFQNRALQAVILMRLDIDGPPHRNPDGEEIPCPHLHIYKEGYGDKWAIAAPVERYADCADLFAAFEAFMTHCNVTLQPQFQRGLF